MRNLKKLLAVVVAICILATFTIPAFAAGSFTYEAQAKGLYDMKLFQGTSSTEFVADLGSQLTREQGITLLVRMFGKEADALAITDADAVLANYTDAKNVSIWAKKYVAYAVKTGMVVGVTTTTLDSRGNLFGNAFATMILKNMGYAQTGADYATASAKLQTKGATLTVDQAAAFAAKALIRDDAVGMMFSSLLAKDSANKTIIENLIAAKIVTEAQAIAAGVYGAELTSTAVQTGAKLVTVTFNRPLTATEKAAATITVKKGLVPYTVAATWATDLKSVVLAYPYNLTAGDYTVTVAGVAKAATVSVAAQAVTKISLTDTYLSLKDDVAIGYVVYNQFNEDMSIAASALNIYVYNATGAHQIADDTNGKIDLLTDGRAGATAALLNDNIIVTISDLATGVNATKTIPVAAAQAAASMTFGTVSPLTNSSRITAGNLALVLPYTFLDQYGKAYTLPTYTDAAADNSAVIGNVSFVSSDPTVIDVDSFSVNSDGVLKFNAGVAGTAVITAVSATTGAVATTSVTVNAVTALKTFTVSEPATLLVNAETATIPYAATDIYGNVIAAADFGYSIAATDNSLVSNEVVLVSTNTAVANFASFAINADTGALEVTPVGAGTTTIYVYVDSVLQNSITVTVNPTAVASQITAVNFAKVFEATSTHTITVDDVTVLDQYNRAFTPVIGTISVVSSAPSVIGVTGLVLTAGTTAGTATLTITVGSVTYDVASSVIASADIAGYSIATIGNVYAPSTTNAAYDKSVTLLGKDASGNTVNLISSAAGFVTSSDLGIANIVAGKVRGLAAGTATISAWIGGTKVASQSVNVVTAAPYAVSVEWAATTIVENTAAGSLKTIITVLDQYGVDITASTAVFFANGTVVNADGSTDDIAAPATEEITVITSNGLTATDDITVTVAP